MELRIDRKYKKDGYTIGKLYINDVYFCDVLEDKDRGLNQKMKLSDIQKAKVYGETAIPTGRYKVTYTYSPKFGKKMPLINNVPGYEGIRIHNGSFPADTYGCPLVGENKIKGGLTNSKITFQKFMDRFVPAVIKESVWVTIE